MQIRPIYPLPLIASLLSAMAGPSMADEGWAGTLGAGAIYAPDYLGSNDYETRVWPAISLSYGDRFYLNSLDGLGWNAFRQGNWLVSPFIGYTPGRDNDHDLSHLDKVDGGATAGLRVAYTNDSWTYSGDAQTPFTGDMDGYQLSLKARWQGQLSKRWSASIGPSLTYSSADWTEDMFGVASRESARSSLAAYNPDDGYFSIALGSTLSYHLTPDWSVTAMASIAQLTGDAKDSPLVDSVGDKNQAYAGAFVSYRF